MRNVENASIWQNMTNLQCLKEYGQEFVSTHGDILAVSHALNDSYSIDFLRSGGPDSEMSAYWWMCLDYPDAQYGQGKTQCRLSDLLKIADNWTISSDLVDYCLSLRKEENCRLQFSLTILILVIICNFVKAACMTLMVYQHDSEPLVTLGDAIASFLNEPDSATQGNCIATKNDFRKSHWTAAANTWQPRQLRWFKNASLKRWLVCNILWVKYFSHFWFVWLAILTSLTDLRIHGLLVSVYLCYGNKVASGLIDIRDLSATRCVIALTTAAVLLSSGVKHIADKSFKGLWGLGFGTVSSQSLLSQNVLSGKTGLFVTVLVANLPQLLLSFLYLTYNGLFTCMLLGQEWNRYAHHRKPLRVSWPTEGQRSTYWLQLPYTYGLPLMVFSGVLHWLVSQSIFLARVAVFDPTNVQDGVLSISTCGYSNIAIVTVILVGTIALVFGNANGFRKYSGSMPLVGSNSAAISAACHAPNGDINASVSPIMWGAVETGGEVGHCCFTSFDVIPCPGMAHFYLG